MGHKVEDQLLFSKLLRMRLDKEAAEDKDMSPGISARWYASKVLSDGTGVIERNYPSVFSGDDPPAYQQFWLDTMCQGLNSQIAHDGAWIVAWTHQPLLIEYMNRNPIEWRRFVMIWVDKDGDPQFVVDNIEPFAVIATVDQEKFIEDGENAYQYWSHLMNDALRPGEGQQIQLAKMLGNA